MAWEFAQSQTVGFGSLPLIEKFFVGTLAALLFSSVAAILAFVSVSFLRILRRHFSRYWLMCFYLSSISLSGWMVLSVGTRLHIGVVFITEAHMLIFWLVALTALLSALLAFARPHRYMVVSVLAVCLVAFTYFFPIFVVGPWGLGEK